jgi:hypothetical protein
MSIKNKSISVKFAHTPSSDAPHIRKHGDPIHCGLRFALKTWTYSAASLNVSTTTRNNSNFTLYKSYLPYVINVLLMF